MRKCLLEPIPEIFEASELLRRGVDAHLRNEKNLARDLFRDADMSIIRDWTEELWGKGGIFSQWQLKLGNPEIVTSDERDHIRMPSIELEKEIIKRDGFCCRFCGIPVIRKEVRVVINSLYPDVVYWGKTNSEQHAAFQAMWLQFDHVIPHARGGKTNFENLIITCAPCNYGRMNYLLSEVEITLLPSEPTSQLNWDGLESIITN